MRAFFFNIFLEIPTEICKKNVEIHKKMLSFSSVTALESAEPLACFSHVLIDGAPHQSASGGFPRHQPQRHAPTTTTAPITIAAGAPRSVQVCAVDPIPMAASACMQSACMQSACVHAIDDACMHAYV